MKQTVVSSFAEPVGTLWRDLQEEYTKEGNFYVVSPLSSTQLPIYDWIIQNAHTFTNWEKMKFVLMDEMLEGEKEPFKYVSVIDTASYEGFALKHFLNPLSEKVSVNKEVIKPELTTIQSFETQLDLLILALGVTGNYANVMPGISEQTGWYISHLIFEFRLSHTQEGSSSYKGANFREFGVSLGPQQVLNAKRAVVIISGEKKRDLTKQLLSYKFFNSEFPLSIIYHSKVADRVEIFLTQDVL